MATAQGHGPGNTSQWKDPPRTCNGNRQRGFAFRWLRAAAAGMYALHASRARSSLVHRRGLPTPGAPPPAAEGHVGSMRPKLTLKQACFQGYPESAVYVQIPVGSRNSASHNAYHTSLRPSSLFEPRHPSLKVVRQVEWKEPLEKIQVSTNEKFKRSRQRSERGYDGPLSPHLLPASPHMGASRE